MRDMLFATASGGALVLAASSAIAQSVPGRDLLDFPVGALAEAPALATDAAGGLYNPAAFLVARDRATRPSRGRVAVAQLSSPGDRGLSGQVASAAYTPSRRWGAALTVARVGVGGITRTDTDPTTPLGTVLYDTFVASAAGAYRVHHHLVAGAAARYRLGRADTARAGVVGADVGVAADRLLGRLDLRLAASSYLWRPQASAADRPALQLAADGRLWGDSTTREARAGYAWSGSRGTGAEGYGFVAGRYRHVEARAGVVRLSGYGDVQTQARFGIGLHYARLSASVARQSGAAFGPLYQFTLSTTLQ